MTPLISSRIFGRVPALRDLTLVRQTTHFSPALWVSDLMGRPSSARLLADESASLGLHFPAAHLPARTNGAWMDLATGTLVGRNSALDTYRSAMDIARQLGSSVAVIHLQARESDEVWHLFDAAEERGLFLALEADVGEHTSVYELLRFVRRVGTHRHGICIDLSRTRLPPEELSNLQRRIVMIEVSSAREGEAHRLPAAHDAQLRAEIRACNEVPYLTYEIVPETPANVPPGEAELTLLLRRLSAWHHAGDERGLWEETGLSI